MDRMERVPTKIVDPENGRVYKYSKTLAYDEKNQLFLGYERDDGNFVLNRPHEIVRNFQFDHVEPKKMIRQGKYECAAASLALLLGHTLFNVKRVMGQNGWRNDDKGTNDKIMRATARDFGRDLVRVGPKVIGCLKDKLPPCSVTVRSLNVEGMGHALTWIDGDIVDPNYGDLKRKFWGADWAPWTVDAHSALVLADAPLTEDQEHELKCIKKNGTVKDMIGLIKEVCHEQGQ